jgi:hypothetical protein
MALLDFTAAFGAGSTNLGNVQSFTIQRGRQWIVDPFNAARCSIIVRDIDAWTTAPKMGDDIELTNVGAFTVFSGTITDVKINYGLIPSMDEAEISCEGNLALLGRRNLRSFVLAQGLTGDQFGLMCDQVNVASAINNSGSIAVAQTVTENALTFANTLALTEVGRISETNGALEWFGRNDFNNGIGYSEHVFNTTGTNAMKYDGIEFRSTAENYYTRVTVEPLGLAAQTNNSGSAPWYSLSVNTYDYSTTQADSLSQYYLNQLSSTTSAPTAITASWANQPDTGTSQDRFQEALSWPNQIAMECQITFRGTVYNAVIEGSTITSTPENTRITFFLSPQDLNNYLKWTSPAPYNTWDNNKWNF